MSETQNKPTGENGNERRIDRRTFMKAAGASAGGAAVVGSGGLDHSVSPLGTVEAFIGVDASDACKALDVTPKGLALTLLGYPPCATASILYDSDPAAIESHLHNLATIEFEREKAFRTLISNRLEETQTMAHIEARHRIASAWEDGKTSSEAYDDALDAIDNYYDGVKQNSVAVMSLVLLQHGAVSQTAIDDAGINDTFLKPVGVESYSGDGSNQTGEERLFSAQIEVEFSKYSEGTFTEVFPEFYFDLGDDADYEQAITESEWMSYDSGTLTLEAPDGEIEWSGEMVVQNVVVEDGDDLPGQDVFHGADFAAIIDTIDNQWTTVRNNYDEPLVSDLYDLLDDGTISPSDIRGIDALATWMSGTTDASESSFRMALQMQLGIEQPDLSEVSHMEIEYRGSTGYEYIEDNPRIGNWVGDDLVGHLFTRGQSVVNTGSSYMTQPYAVWERGHEADMVIARMTNDGFEIISNFSTGANFEDDERRHTAFDDENGVLALGVDGSIRGVNVTTAESWNKSGIHPVYIGGRRMLIRNGTDLEMISTTDGSVMATFEFGADRVGHLVSTDAQYVYYITEDGTDVQLVKRKLEVGSDIEWSVDIGSDSTYHFLSMAPDDEFLALGFGRDLLKIDPVDGSTLESASPSRDVRHVHTNGLQVAVAGQNDIYWEVFDAENFSSNFGGTHGDTHYGVNSIWLDPSNSFFLVMASGWTGVELRDAGNGAEIASREDRDPRGQIIQSRTGAGNPSGDGIVDAAYFFDAVTGDELQLLSGLFTVSAMYDADGEEVESTEYDVPEYDTIDMETYQDLILQLEETMQALTEDDTWSSDDDDVTFGGGSLFGDLDWPLTAYQTVIAGAAVLIAYVLANTGE